MPKSQHNIIYPKVKLRDVLGAFWRGMAPQKWKLFLIMTSVIFISVFNVVVPIFYKQFFDIIVAGGDKMLVVSQLLNIIVIIAILHSIIWVLYRVASFLNNIYQPSSMTNLRQQAYDHLIEHSYSFFTNNFVGALVQRVNRFARAFERISDDIIWNIAPLIVRALAIIFVVFFVNQWMALVILIWIVIFIGFNIVFSQWKLKYDIQNAEMDSKATAYLADTLTNQNSITLFGGLPFEKKGYRNVTNQQRILTTFTWHLGSVADAVQAFLSFAIEFILFYFAIRYWGNGLITVGVFAMLQAYILTLIDQVWGMNRIVKDLYQAYADAKEMVEIMKLPHEIKDIPGAKDLAIEKGEIEFKNLNFNFNETRKILEDINLVIKPGEKVALIGPSGAGKTTFIRLLLKLYVPTSGEILIDGQDIQKITQESLRKNISMVPQDTILFHRTLADNIAYGKRDLPARGAQAGATKEEIEKAATLAHCDEFIKDLPFGFGTFVGERGIKLSGGERQRVAIARAILKNAPILVLDEATSSLDSHSEMMIQDALNTLMAGKTTIVIAHRLSTIQKMDRIIVIDGGKVLEQGSHNDLLANENSLYKKLWTLQAGGFLNEDEEEEKSEDDKTESYE